MSGREIQTGEAVPEASLDLSFEDVVALATQLCGTPTALISLLYAGRQWFKARLGFACEVAELNTSVCRHVVEKGQTIVIPDLTVDPCTVSNPLVTNEPFLRFYAGVPLRARLGTIGALCVIDTVPRERGLLLSQREGLERLARQAVALLEAEWTVIKLATALRGREDHVGAGMSAEAADRDPLAAWIRASMTFVGSGATSPPERKEL